MDTVMYRTRRSTAWLSPTRCGDSGYDGCPAAIAAIEVGTTLSAGAIEHEGQSEADRLATVGVTLARAAG
jgi:hypothetical protein